MRKRRSRRVSRLAFALVTLAMLAVWILFAPMQFGGNAAYVIIYGNSMEPVYLRNDLVILRKDDHPQVGDIYAYQQPQIGLVIHRIIDRQGRDFVFKGDNNSFVDSYFPTQDELVGKAWIHIPQGGQALLWLRQPWVLAGMVLAVGGFFMAELSHDPAKDRKRNWSGRGLLQWPKAPTPGSTQEIILLLLPLLFLVFAILAFVAYRTPTSLVSRSALQYTHLLIFDYSALTGSPLFEGGRMKAPQPIYPRLACNVDFVLSYAFGASLPADVTGDYRLVARLSEPSGWYKDIELVPTTTFGGENFSSRFRLDVCELQEIASQFVAATGVPRNTFEVSILPEIRIAGSLADYPLEERVAPELKFALDGSQFALLQGASDNPLQLTLDGIVSLNDLTINTFPVFGMQVPILAFRILSALGMVLTLAGIVFFGWPYLQAIRADETRAIHARYGENLVRLAAPVGAPGQPLIQVASMEDLARLAQNTGQPIFEYDDGENCVYSVSQAGTNYQFVVRKGKGQS